MILGALAEGKTVLKNVLIADDTRYMIEALKTMGVEIELDENDQTIEIKGLKKDAFITGQCFVGNAGTAMRFLASFATVHHCDVVLDGNERMKERPIGDLVDILNQLGAEITYLEKEGYPPIRVKSSGLQGGLIKMKGDISSQFISSLLLAAPKLKSELCIEIINDLVSKPYVNMTIEMMKEFGAIVQNNNNQRFTVHVDQKYKGSNYIVESDCSSASYFFAAAAVANGDIVVENIRENSLQGDIKLLDLLKRMGAKVEYGQNFVRVIGDQLIGIDVDMKDISDVALTLAVAALFAKGETVIRNVYNMRLKETDRISALCNELRKFGAFVEEYEDGLKIVPSNDYKAADIDTYDDHRMAMSFAVAGLKIEGVRISNPACVSKTFPNFFIEFEKIYNFKV
jgi:3-phosphoshikimate 1-carboxyvinyltransferase